MSGRRVKKGSAGECERRYPTADVKRARSGPVLRSQGGWHPWTSEDEERLLREIGDLSVAALADALGRSPDAVRSKLHRCGMNPSLIRDGLSQRALAREVGSGRGTIRSWKDKGYFNLDETRVASGSLYRLCLERGIEAGPLEAKESYSQTEAAEILGVSERTVRRLIQSQNLREARGRIRDEEIIDVCRRADTPIDHAAVRDTGIREWLFHEAGLVRPRRSRKWFGVRRHLSAVHACERCGLRIRGNAYYRHVKFCLVAPAAGT